MPERIDPRSLDVASQRRAELKALFPAAFTEVEDEKGRLRESINFETLKAELGSFSDVFENRRERYGMDWPGKKDCLKLVQQRSHATLNPCRDASVNFDSTENLVIEGDNLEVLKLLQKSYYGKVKMIYIDPPYNTGKEFIYPDNYAESLDTYLEYAGLIDSEGKRFATNTANEGRFHTKWLNMMYPRLYLARNLLRDDGVIFISIGDHELCNLQTLCNEIFGEENCIGVLTREMKKGANRGTHFSPATDFVLAYARQIDALRPFHLPFDEDYITSFRFDDDDGRGPYKKVALYEPTLDYFPNCRYAIECPDGEVVITPPNKSFRCNKESFLADLQDHRIVFERKECKLLNQSGQPGNWNVYSKLYLNDMRAKGRRPSNLIMNFINAHGTRSLAALDMNIFEYSKPIELIQWLCRIVHNSNANETVDDIILDFFAGSGTTAQAVLELNKQDGGNRKFILVQLPEPCAEDSEAFKAGFSTISDIAMERVRRVIQKLDDEDRQSGKSHSGEKQNRGFRVLTLGATHFRQWPELQTDVSIEQVVDQLVMHVDHIEPDVDPEDLLFEVLIKAGIAPTAKIETVTLAGLPVYSISQGEILICLAETVTQELMEAVTKAAPKQFLCLDRAFKGNDQLRTNASQAFEARLSGRDNAPTIAFRTI